MQELENLEVEVISFVNDKGRKNEFEKLIERTKKQAYNIAYRMTGNKEDAEDLTQEAYLRAFRSFDKYNRMLPFENWFFRILSNLFVDGLRRKPKQTPISLNQPVGSDGNESYTLEIADDASNPESLILEGIMDEQLQKALASLPIEFRSAVLLCDVEGLSYQQIAEKMGTSIGTVRSRIHRGRLMLRKALNTINNPSKSRKKLQPVTVNYSVSE